MIITVAFKKKKYTPFTLNWIVASGIKLTTGSKYYHNEIIIKDKWISSGSPLGAGIRINDLRPLNNENWDYIDVEVDGRKVKRVMKFIEENLDTTYDWFGALFGGGFNSSVGDKDKWFCSELVIEILMKFNYMKEVDANTYSPEDVYQLLTEVK